MFNVIILCTVHNLTPVLRLLSSGKRKCVYDTETSTRINHVEWCEISNNFLFLISFILSTYILLSVVNKSKWFILKYKYIFLILSSLLFLLNINYYYVYVQKKKIEKVETKFTF